MKRSFILLFIFLFFNITIIPSVNQAGTKLFYNGIYHDYNAEPVNLVINGEKINPSIPPVILFNQTLVPTRSVFEKLGADVSWNQDKMEATIKSQSINLVLKPDSTFAIVNGKEEKLGLPAEIINNNIMIPLRFVSEKLGMKVEWENSTRTVKITKNSPEVSGDINVESVNYISDGSVKITANNEITSYNKGELHSPERIYIDINGAILNNSVKSSVVVDSELISKIRSAQNKISPNVTRVAVELKKKSIYKIDYSDDKKSLIISFGQTSSQPNIKIGNVDDYGSFNSHLGDNNKVSLTKEFDKAGLIITMDSSQTYNVSRLTNSDEIAIDISNAKFSQDAYEIQTSNETIKSLKCMAINDGKGRIILGVVGQPQYQVFQEPNKLSIYVFKPQYKNIRYSYQGEYSKIDLEGQNISNNITVSDNGSKKIVLSMPSNLTDIGNGIMEINDSLVRSIEIGEIEGNNTIITINQNYDGKLYIETKYEGANTVIYLKTTEDTNKADDEYVVVIDAGHGGKDTGAVYKENYAIKLAEKDVNLDIELRLNRLLKEKGIKTVMTRDKDVFIELKERANIANRINADLFVSIHSNSINSPSYAGTMTLYYPDDDNSTGISSKGFAEIVQKELIGTLKTIDRKIIPRPNLVVLNSTNMPAVLAEIAFISNKDDREKLSSNEFKETAAKALCTSIMKALEKINK